MTTSQFDPDPKLVQLQESVIEFVTSIILKFELDFYRTMNDVYPDQLEQILAKTDKTIIDMIMVTNNKFFNQLYFDIQNKNYTPLVTLILRMNELTTYGPHILLDKLIRYTLDIHAAISREKLCVDSADVYSKSVLIEINLQIRSNNFYYAFSTNESESQSESNLSFVHVPAGEKPFNIIIDQLDFAKVDITDN